MLPARPPFSPRTHHPNGRRRSQFDKSHTVRRNAIPICQAAAEYARRRAPQPEREEAAPPHAETDIEDSITPLEFQEAIMRGLAGGGGGGATVDVYAWSGGAGGAGEEAAARYAEVWAGPELLAAGRIRVGPAGLLCLMRDWGVGANFVFSHSVGRPAADCYDFHASAHQTAAEAESDDDE